jgi:hypothetical protein
MRKWQPRPSVLLGILLIVIAALVTVLYYLNYPPIEQTLDTPSYLYSMHQMQLIGNPVNDQRLPTYPLFLLLIFAISGQGNLTAVEIVQGILFVCVVGEMYVLGFYLFRKTWLAFAISLLVGTDVILVSFVKPIMTEGLSLWLVTSMVLMVVLFLKTSHWRYLWLAIVMTGFLLFIRPEWIFFPCLLFPYLYWSKRADVPRKQFIRRLFAALLILYLPVVCYIVANYFINGTPTLTTISYVNIFGKIVEYRMQDESPANPTISHFINSSVQHGTYSPWQIIGHSSQLQQNHAKAAADFAQSIILHHPFEFFLKSVPLFFSQLSSYRPSDVIVARGSFDAVLAPLFAVQIFLYHLNWLFPFCALAWLALLCHSRSRSSFLVRMMALIVLLVISIVVIQVFGEFDVAYYTRLHVEIDPLMMLVIWGSVGLLISYVVRAFLRRYCQLNEIC